MRLPLPVLYVAEAPDGRIIVVDGLQRLSTFHRYLNGDFKLQFQKEEDGNKHPLHGKRFTDLELRLRERIEDTQLTLYILDPKAPERAKLDIFERVNGGMPLTRQQMRNCLYNGPATNWLRAAAGSDSFKAATGESLDPRPMRDREAINRFCAFRLLGWQNYRASGDLDNFLAEALNRMNQMSPVELSEMRTAFEQSMNINFDLFKQHAFRKSILGDINGNRSVLNIALFDVCSVLFSQCASDRVRSKAHHVVYGVQQLLKDQNFVFAITYSTNSRKQVLARFEMMAGQLESILS
jgi:hypothetical protein